MAKLFAAAKNITAAGKPVGEALYRKTAEGKTVPAKAPLEAAKSPEGRGGKKTGADSGGGIKDTANRREMS